MKMEKYGLLIGRILVGNAAADVAKTYLWFNLHNQNELSKNVKRYVERSVMKKIYKKLDAVGLQRGF